MTKKVLIQELLQTIGPNDGPTEAFSRYDKNVIGVTIWHYNQKKTNFFSYFPIQSQAESNLFSCGHATL